MTLQQQWEWAEPDIDPAQSSRDYQRELMAEKRAKEREICIPELTPEIIARREEYRDSAESFMMYYAPEIFYNPFTPDQRELIEAIVKRIYYGGYQAIAAARGDGKTSIIKWVVIWALLYGHVHYPVIIAANGKMAKAILDDIKLALEFNDRLHADFPEVCVPIRALNGAAQRAKGQTVNGERTRIEWQQDYIVLPHIEGSDSSGSIVAVRGLDSAIRGLVRGELRPDLPIIDDPQDRESASSRLQIQTRKETIQQDILGLAGPGRSMAAVMACTKIKCDDLADEMTDRTRQPAWMGIVQRFVVQYPDRTDLWSQYITLRQQDQIDGDATGRKAHAFYLKNRSLMDAGAVVNNPYRYINKSHHDGSQIEVSPIQHAYNKIADMGQEAFDAEFNNDPHALNAESMDINDMAVCKKLSNLDRGKLPDGCQKVTSHIDVHGRRLDYCITAWSKGLTGSVIDYGEHLVHSPAGLLTSEDNIEHTRAAILTALLSLREIIEEHNPDIVTIDSGWQPDPVYRFCKIAGARWRPTKGYGQGYGGKFHLPSGRMAPSRRGGHYYQSRPPGKPVWIVNYDADHYKREVHTGFMTPDGSPGSITLFGDQAGEHREFARQICAEQWVRSFSPGKGWVSGFNVIHHHNHKLDCLAGCMLGAELCRIQPAERITHEQPDSNQATKRKKRRISFADRRKNVS